MWIASKYEEMYAPEVSGSGLISSPPGSGRSQPVFALLNIRLAKPVNNCPSLKNVNVQLFDSLTLLYPGR